MHLVFDRDEILSCAREPLFVALARSSRSIVDNAEWDVVTPRKGGHCLQRLLPPAMIPIDVDLRTGERSSGGMLERLDPGR
jgi:hypothetical protein